MKAAKGWLLLLVGLLIFLVSIIRTSGGDTVDEASTIFEAKVYGSIVKIEVPDKVYLGEVGKGYKTDPDTGDKIWINSSSNVDIRVKPVLEQPNDIFSNLFFSETLTNSDFKKIGEFSILIHAPNKFLEKKADYIYAKLDLTNYTGDMPLGINLMNANVKFFATMAN